MSEGTLRGSNEESLQALTERNQRTHGPCLNDTDLSCYGSRQIGDGERGEALAVEIRVGGRRDQGVQRACQ